MKNNNYDYTELINNIKNNNEQSFNELVSLTRDRVFFRARTSVGDNQTADDICQEVFIKVYKNINNLEDPKTFIAWLDTITRNCCNEYYRKSYKKVDSETEAEVFSYDAYEDFDVVDTNIENQPELAFSKKEKEELVYGIIDALPAAQKQAIMMYYYDEMKIKDIAAELEVNENTIKSRLSLAKKEIEVKVEELNKKHGIKLYNFAPFTLFIYLLKGLKTDNSLLGSVASNTVTSLASKANTLTANSKIATTAILGEKATISSVAKAASMSLASKIAIGATVAIVAIGGTIAVIQPEKVKAIFNSEPVVEQTDVTEKETNADTAIVLEDNKTHVATASNSLESDSTEIESKEHTDVTTEDDELTDKLQDEFEAETIENENNSQNVLKDDENNEPDSEISEEACYFSYETNEYGYVNDPNACNYGAHIESGNNDHIYSQSYENDKGQSCYFEEDVDNIPEWVDTDDIYYGEISLD